jgi:hypothetical protein
MKLIFSLLLSAGFLLTNNFSYSQYAPGALGYHDQALMFSSYEYIGSARIQGIGNTQISLGGDISSALANPAGLGFYNRSELSITPAYNLSLANSSYLSNETSSSSGNFNINNLGVVFNKTKDEAIPGKWRGGSFAISFSKVNKFNDEIKYSGDNQNNDILDFYIQDANRQDVDGFQLKGITYGAYSSYLISEFLDAYVDGNDTTYAPSFYERTFFSEYPTENAQTHQSEIMSSSGGQSQWNFSAGGNYGDFLYFGATLGIQSLNYNVVKQYTETYPGIDGDIVASSTLTEDLTTKGYGVNATFGLIARPINQLTLGFSLITPTYLSLNEKYNYSSEAEFNDFDMDNYGDYFDANYDLIADPNADFTTFYKDDAFLNKEIYEEESFFDYTLTTPLRINAGATFFINKNGFLSADIEYVDYSTMKLKGEQWSLENDNSDIKDLYSSVVNFKVGGEWRIKSFRLRAGYNYRPSPYNADDIERKTQVFSAGLGIRSSKYFVDLAASYNQFTNIYAPYILENPNGEDYLETSLVGIENTNMNFALTVGLFF